VDSGGAVAWQRRGTGEGESDWRSGAMSGRSATVGMP
jgi:hypothetical protein